MRKPKNMYSLYIFHLYGYQSVILLNFCMHFLSLRPFKKCWLLVMLFPASNLGFLVSNFSVASQWQVMAYGSLSRGHFGYCKESRTFLASSNLVVQVSKTHFRLLKVP